MAKVYVDEVKTAVDLYKAGFLDKDINTSKSVTSQMTDFINYSSDKLTGDMWDAVRTKMEEFQTAFSKLGSVTDEFGQAIQTALDMLYDCVGDNTSYDFLDDSLLADLKNQLAQLQAQLATLEKGETVVSEDSQGNQTTSVNYDYAKINSVKQQILETDALIKKTEEFQVVYQKVVDMLEAAFQKVQVFANEASNIQVSSKVIYNGVNL